MQELICSCEDVLPEGGEYIEGAYLSNPSAVYKTVSALLIIHQNHHQPTKKEDVNNDEADNQQMMCPATNNNSTQHQPGSATSILKVNNLNLPPNSNKFKLLDLMPNNNLNTNLNNVKKVVTKRIEFYEDYGIGAGAITNQKSNNIYSIYNPITTSTSTEKVDGAKKFLPLNGCCNNLTKTQDSSTLTYILSGIFIFTFLFLFFFPIPN